MSTIDDLALNSASSSLKFGLNRVGAAQTETLLATTIATSDHGDVIARAGNLPVRDQALRSSTRRLGRLC